MPFIPIQLSFKVLVYLGPYRFIFLAFNALGPYAFIFQAFGMLSSYAFIFLAFHVHSGPIHSYFWLLVLAQAAILANVGDCV